MPTWINTVKKVKRRPQRIVRNCMLTLLVIIITLQMSIVNVQLTTANSESLINRVSGLTVYDFTQDGIDDVVVVKYLVKDDWDSPVEYHSRLVLLDGRNGETVQTYGAEGLGKTAIREVIPIPYGPEQTPALLVIDASSLWLADGTALDGPPLWGPLTLSSRMTGAVVGDLFGNGSQVALVWAQWLYAIDILSGKSLWTLKELPKNLSHDRFGIVRFTQLDTDPMAELLTTTISKGPESYILALDGENGHVRWAKPRSTLPSFESAGVFFAADINQDAIQDIILVYEYNFTHQELVALDGKDRSLLWRVSGVFGTRWIDPSCLQDFNGDEMLELAIWERLPDNRVRPAMYNLTSGQMIWKNHSIQVYNQIGVALHPDSLPQVISITNTTITAVSGTTGIIQWSASPLWSISDLESASYSQLLAVGNFTGDRTLDIVVGHYWQGEVWMLDGLTHEVRWHLPPVTTRLSTTKATPIKFTAYVIVILACVRVVKRRNKQPIEIY
ncbi:MAG: hypothetical protein ACFFGZ_11070 [Candidatus Thorarchaeota archaeon]